MKCDRFEFTPLMGAHTIICRAYTHLFIIAYSSDLVGVCAQKKISEESNKAGFCFFSLGGSDARRELKIKWKGKGNQCTDIGKRCPSCGLIRRALIKVMK